MTTTPSDRPGVIRVLVVDDSPVVRRLVASALATDPDVEICGQATNGREAIEMVSSLEPDAVTLDIEMPEVDGLGALAGIRRTHPRLPVIMFSTLTERGAVKTLEALSLGASDYVTKPANVGSVAESVASVREQLLPKIKALTGVRRMVAAAGRDGTATRPTTPATGAGAAATTPVRPPAGSPGGPSTGRTLAGEGPQGPFDLLVVGCSTGGPDALTSVVEQLPLLPVPVVVVQHMPPLFTTMFAQRLDRVSPAEVREAEDGDEARPGRVLLAPGDFHVRLRRSAGVLRAHLDQGPQENFCRPAVDPLFRSALQVCEGRVLAVVLTGMGQDGLEGVRALHAAGARVLVQDEATSVVWGMPAAVAGAGLAHEVLPLPEVAPRITALLARQPVRA